MTFSKTHNYDPRYERAQTIKGAKARYVDEDLPEYDLNTLEADIERILYEGDMPDGYKGVYRRSGGISAYPYEKECPTCQKWAEMVPCENCKTPKGEFV